VDAASRHGCSPNSAPPPTSPTSRPATPASAPPAPSPRGPPRTPRRPAPAAHHRVRLRRRRCQLRGEHRRLRTPDRPAGGRHPGSTRRPVQHRHRHDHRLVYPARQAPPMSTPVQQSTDDRAELPPSSPPPTAELVRQWQRLTAAQDTLLRSLERLRPGHGATTRIRGLVADFNAQVGEFDRLARALAERWAAQDLPVAYRDGALRALEQAAPTSRLFRWSRRPPGRPHRPDRHLLRRPHQPHPGSRPPRASLRPRRPDGRPRRHPGRNHAGIDSAAPGRRPPAGDDHLRQPGPPPGPSVGHAPRSPGRASSPPTTAPSTPAASSWTPPGSSASTDQSADSSPTRTPITRTAPSAPPTTQPPTPSPTTAASGSGLPRPDLTGRPGLASGDPHDDPPRLPILDDLGNTLEHEDVGDRRCICHRRRSSTRR
jgi:hypothetical protein